MPVILKLDFTDGTTETIRIPAEVWRQNSQQVTWQYVTPKTLRKAEVDPLWETADADRGNNVIEGSGTPVTLKVTTPEPAKDDRIRDDDLKVLPDSLQTYPATPRPVGDGPAPVTPGPGGVAPAPANAPAVPRGEPVPQPPESSQGAAAGRPAEAPR
jgi:aminopeptidase N